MQLVVLTLDGQRFALPLEAVERVVRAVELLPLPGAPEVVLGAVNVCGSILPVYCARKRFGFPERNVSPDQLLLLAHCGARSVGVMVDDVLGVIRCGPGDVVPAAGVSEGLHHFDAVAKLADGMVLIHDLDKFLSGPELAQLAQAMEQAA